MREIIFRSAHYDYNDNFSHFTKWGRLNHKLEPIHDDSCFVSPSQTNGTYIKSDEQYTGLKDKNGKKIFEGDILEWPSGKHVTEKICDCEECGCSETFERYVKFNERGVVKWINAPQGFSNTAHFTGGGYKAYIIGNIHENPDLLK